MFFTVKLPVPCVMQLDLNLWPKDYWVFLSLLKAYQPLILQKYCMPLNQFLKLLLSNFQHKLYKCLFYWLFLLEQLDLLYSFCNV